MPDRSSSLSSLQARKQMLVIEAELHRVHMRECLTDLKTSIQGIEDTVTKGRALLRLAGMVMSGLTLFRRFRSGKGSFLSKLLAGISVGSGLWFANKARARAD